MTAQESLQPRLALLEARDAAQRLASTYCFGMDRCDRNVVLSCFTSDVAFRRQDRSWGVGRDELWRLLSGQLASMRPSWHVSTATADVTPQPDGRMRARHYGYVETGIEGALVVAGVTYHHRLRQIAGEWLIDERALDFWYFARADRLRACYRDRDRVWWQGAPPPTYPQHFSGFRGFDEPDWNPSNQNAASGRELT